MKALQRPGPAVVDGDGELARDEALGCIPTSATHQRATDADTHQRNLPARGFRPGYILLGMGVIMGYGWYKLFHGMRELKYAPPPSPKPNPPTLTLKFGLS